MCITYLVLSPLSLSLSLRLALIKLRTSKLHFLYLTLNTLDITAKMQPLVNQHDNTCPKCNAAIEGAGKTCGACGAVCLEPPPPLYCL
jgi:hypothetical protein